jgi:hypothetical protein
MITPEHHARDHGLWDPGVRDVGQGIPDVIIGRKTGFIMENNFLKCIVENVIPALNSPDLEQIADDGRDD